MTTIDKWAGYRAAIYEVFGPDMTFRLIPGQSSQLLNALLVQYRTNCAAFITACNPGAEQLSNADNAERMGRLHHHCAKIGYPVFPGRGGARDWGWEDSLLILTIPEDDALRLGREHGQDAILIVDHQQRIQLRACTTLSPIKMDKSHD
ncbi:DUF3293 domain-containing protein [uncultured Ruegeria sp.]|uniref:DUF3293 domain-containing protein n=1 Tax=uncultured Ruegeria sp. TaxID=259304 RepID=UPI0026176D5B|nr:DUF3293 domain-containing protein [uncultured Ruegeria sp.]